MPSVKTIVLGDPLATDQSLHQRLSNPVALAVFSSDALSSVAYATEEILLQLVMVGSAALALSLPIAAGIAALLVIVATSYRQTIRAYPGGGGSYIVARENLGTVPGLIAGASLLIDYVLTVAVSIAAGTAAIVSALPATGPYRVEMAVGFTLMLMLANLRGVKESGTVFAGPTYFFVGALAVLIAVGTARHLFGGGLQVEHHAIEATKTLTMFVVLKAFASGCTAMTGVEAIANGVQAFRQPEADNARKTLTWMAGILVVMFLGITYLAWSSGVTPVHGGSETVISQIARAVFGTGPLYYAIQAGTAAILILAANTAYADFPRLASFMAIDGFLPKQFMERGYRLVHSNGILFLTVVSVALLVVFSGDTHRLIPLYAVGVFTSFTLSQSGMVVHWWKCREANWKRSIVVNAAGAVTTFVVLMVIAAAKFKDGAWLVVVLVPVLVFFFRWIRSHYDEVVDRLAIPPGELARVNWQSFNRMHNHVVLLVSSIDRRLVRALQYARSLKADYVEAIFVDVAGDHTAKMQADWEKAGFGIRLTVLPSPYREIIKPIEEYVRAIPRPTADHVVTVILPEFVPENLTDAVLHNQTPFWIKTAMFDEPGVIVVDVPYHLGHEGTSPLAGARPEMKPAD